MKFNNTHFQKVWGSGVRWAFFKDVRWHFSLSKPVIFQKNIAKKSFSVQTNFLYKI